MIDIAQDGTSPEVQWLDPLAAEREMRLAVHAEVTHRGSVAVGDAMSICVSPAEGATAHP